jgi:hypothetical protein
MTEEQKEYSQYVQARFENLDLTLDQAFQIHLHEEEKNSLSSGYLMSTWEEYDFDFMKFRHILNDKQLNEFGKKLDDLHKSFAESEREQTESHQKRIKYLTELIAAADSFKSDIVSLRPYVEFSGEFQIKRTYLKEEYSKFIIDTNSEYTTQHLRFNKHYNELELKSHFLSNKLIMQCWPNYCFFKEKMDEPTKAVAKYCYDRVSSTDNLDNFIKELFDKIAATSNSIYKKHYQEEKPRGWVINLNSTEQEQKENRLMGLVLYDPKKYGC